MNVYTKSEIRSLATLAAADYAASCKGPTIRGLNGEKNLRGTSLEKVAQDNGLSLEEAKKITIDLQTARFDELPPHWQEVNLATARTMIELIEPLGGKFVIMESNLDDPTVRARMGSIIHKAWLQLPQNSWATGSDLDRPFSELPAEEQDKDIQQIRSLQRWLICLEY